MRKTIGALLGAVVLALVPASAEALTKNQAQRAVVAKAKRVYSRQMRYGAYAECKTLSSTLFDCEYGADLAPGEAFNCGFEQGYNGSNDPCPIGYAGSAKVRVFEGGPLVELGRVSKLYI